MSKGPSKKGAGTPGKKIKKENDQRVGLAKEISGNKSGIFLLYFPPGECLSITFT